MIIQWNMHHVLPPLLCRPVFCVTLGLLFMSAAELQSAATLLATASSTQVQQHPGSFEEYGNHLASVLHGAVREHMAIAAAAAAAAKPAGPAPAAPGRLGNPAGGTMRLRVTGAATPGAAAAEPLLHTAVIRGCVQAVLWGWVPEGALAESDAAAAQRLLQRLAGRLMAPGLAGAGAGGVRGVSVQVGQAVAVARDQCKGGGLQHQGEEEVLRIPGVMTDSGSSIPVSRLLKLDPPATAASPGLLTVRLLLHSPAPQPARMLVLAERQGAGGAVPPRAVLLREVAVALEGGVQEVEVELGAGELAGAGEGGGLPVGADALRVMMVGPVHMSTSAASGQQDEPCPPPLVHWVAPPLLLLPGEAVGELCGLWEQMKREQGEEREQQERQDLQGQATPDVSLPQGPAPTGPTAALAGVEQESSLWWSHMAPLMGDLAHALSAWHAQGQEWEDVTCQLLDFLYSNGLHHTAALLQETPSRSATAAPAATAVATAAPAAIAVATAAPAAAAALPRAATAAGGGKAGAGKAAAGLPEPTALRALQLELGLRRWPPGQEAAYRACVRQRASPHLLTLVDVACFVIMVVRSALGRLPAGALVTALLATWVGVAEVTVWAWAPGSRRRGGGSGGGGGGGGLWRRLREVGN